MLCSPEVSRVKPGSVMAVSVKRMEMPIKPVSNAIWIYMDIYGYMERTMKLGACRELGQDGSL